MISVIIIGIRTRMCTIVIVEEPSREYCCQRSIIVGKCQKTAFKSINIENFTGQKKHNNVAKKLKNSMSIYLFIDRNFIKKVFVLKVQFRIQESWESFVNAVAKCVWTAPHLFAARDGIGFRPFAIAIRGFGRMWFSAPPARSLSAIPRSSRPWVRRRESARDAAVSGSKI